MTTAITQLDTLNILQTSVTQSTSTYAYPSWYGWNNWWGWNWGSSWNWGFWAGSGGYNNTYNGYYGFGYWGNYYNTAFLGYSSYGGYGPGNIQLSLATVGAWWWGNWGGIFATTSTTSTTTKTSISQVPYIRNRNVNVSAKGLRPFTRVYPFFDDTRVDVYVKPQTGSMYGDITFNSSVISNVADVYGKAILIPTLSPISGDGITNGSYIRGNGALGAAPFGLYNSAGATQPSLYTLKQINIKLDRTSTNFGDPIITDQAGNIEAIFSIPNNSNLKFTVGDKVFKFSDALNPLVDEESTSAAAHYQASGDVAVVQNNITRVVDTSRTYWYDPLAESFLFSGSDNAGGVFLTKIDLYFQNIDTTLPIILELRTMENGFPTQNLVDKAAQVVLYPSSITTSTDSSVSTSFVFSHPIYVESDVEYCFVVRSNSNKYMVWQAVMGETKVNSTETISKQPYSGVLFKSQNNSTWTVDQFSDLKFNIYKAKFDPALRTGDGKGVAILKNTLPKNNIARGPIFELKPNSQEIIVRVPDHGFNINSKVKLKVNPFIAQTTSGSTNLVVSDTTLLTNASPLIVTGTPVGGPGIPYGATVTVSGSTVTLSVAATTSNVSELYFGWVTVGKDITVNKAIEAYKVSYNRASGSLSVANDTTGTGAFNVNYADSRTFVYTADGTTQSTFSINSVTLSGNTTISTNTITSTSIITPSGTVDYTTLAGYTVTGTGVPAGTTIISAIAGTITLSANATSSNTGLTYTLVPADRRGAGSVVLAVLEPDQRYANIKLATSDHIFPKTALGYFAKTTSSTSNDASVAVQVPYVKDTTWGSINSNADIQFLTPKAVVSTANAINPANNIGGSSLDIKILLESNSLNVSPVVDLSSISSAVIDNVLDNPTIAGRPYDNLKTDVIVGANVSGTIILAVGSNINRLLVGMYIYTIDGVDYSSSGISISAVDFINSNITLSAGIPVSSTNTISFVSGQIIELDPYRGSTAAKYVIAPVTLTIPATAIRVIFAANLVPENGIDVYFKSVNINDAGSQQIYEKPWTAMPFIGVPFYSSNTNQYTDFKYEINNLPNAFNVFMIKVVFRGTNNCKPPKIKDFRCVALAS